MGKHFKQTNKKLVFLSILRILFFIMLIISIVYIAKWYIDSKQNKIIEEKISEAKNIENEDEIDAEFEVNFEKLKKINDQVVAWLKVNGTNIDYPVVQAKDNNYYLKRNLDKKYNIGGWIFADYKNTFDGTDKNIVIYGHNMKDNSMFGTLKNILKEEWYNNEENYVLDLVTKNREQKYQVFSVYQIESEEYYIRTKLEEDEFEEFVDTLKERSVKDFKVEFSEGDSILTLSTCGDNNKYRIVLHAKEIKE